MKKYLTVSNLIKAVAVVLGIVAFCLMFGDQVYYQISALGQTSDPYYVDFTTTFFGSSTSIGGTSVSISAGSVVGFIGYIIIIVAAIAGVVAVFVPSKGIVGKVVAGVVAVLFVVGAILVFCTAAGLNGANDVEMFKLAACPIVAGILAIVAGAGYCVSAFISK